jgi:hypothetical protein
MRHARSRLLIGMAFALACGLFSVPKAMAAGCDLSTATSTCGPIDTALYSVLQPHPTGSGVIDSFLRIQQDTTEEGYNTSARVTDPAFSGQSAGFCTSSDCNSKTDLTFTHDLLTSNALVQINGQDYLQFFLDINEPNGNKQFLTLDQLEIFTSPTASLDQHIAAPQGSTGAMPGASLFYSLDSGMTDNWVNLDYSLINHNGGGSGWGDMEVLIPVSNSASLGTYLYLYSEFGCVDGTTGCLAQSNSQMAATNKYQSQDGYEEWWREIQSGGGGGGGISAVPEPGTLFLLGTGVIAVARKRSRARK